MTGRDSVGMAGMGSMGMTSKRAPGSSRSGRGAALRYTVVGTLGACLLLFALAGCGDDAASATSTPTSPASATATTAAAGPTNTPKPFPTVIASPTPTGPGAQAGAADICSQPASVTSQPPSSIPAYPGATLHITNTSGSNGFYGYCSSDTVQHIFSYYQQQLPGKGWGNLKTYTIDTVQQIKATQGDQQLTVTISPDATLANTTNISITLLAQAQ